MPRLKDLGYSSLFRDFPDLEPEWDPENSLDPLKLSKGSSISAKWICPLGHHYTARVDHRTSSSSGCSICSGTVVLEGFNDLLSDNPSLSSEWDYTKNTLTPSEVHKGSPSKFWWVCSLGHSWDASVDKRNSGGRGCRFCKKGILLQGFNDLASTRPELCSQWDFTKNLLNPWEVTTFNNNYVWWVCVLGHSWYASISNRSLRGDGCSRCPNRGTSGAEVFLANGLEKSFGISVSRSHRLDLPFRTRKYLHVDSYFEYKGHKVCVEYDGMYWHREKSVIDTEKTEAILTGDYVLIRIRERTSKSTGLGILGIENPRLLQVENIWDSYGGWVEPVVLRIKQYIERLGDEQVSSSS